MKIYIEAKSKADLNRRLVDGSKFIYGIEYNAFSPHGYMTDHILQDCVTGTLICIFSECSGGSPVGKSWGTWNADKNQVL